MMYGVRFEESANGVGAYLPDVPGVAVVGDDQVHALELLDAALQWHIDGLIEDGEPIPEATADPAAYKWHIIPQRLFIAHVSGGAAHIKISNGDTGPNNPWNWQVQLREESSEKRLELVATSSV